MKNAYTIKVAPSLLAADFSCVSSEIKRAEESGADMLHIDVMDGHFVKNITLGPFIVKVIRKNTRLPLVCHLMIENPGDYIKDFAVAGADMIVFHIETVKNPISLIRAIRRLKKRAGVSLKPCTAIECIKPVIRYVDEVLIMTVEPGFGGQKFLQAQLKKIKKMRMIYEGDIAVDGGVNYHTAVLAVKNGANVLVAGTYLFNSNNMQSLINRLKHISHL